MAMRRCPVRPQWLRDLSTPTNIDKESLDEASDTTTIIGGHIPCKPPVFNGDDLVSFTPILSRRVNTDIHAGPPKVPFTITYVSAVEFRQIAEEWFCVEAERAAVPPPVIQGCLLDHQPDELCGWRQMPRDKFATLAAEYGLGPWDARRRYYDDGDDDDDESGADGDDGAEVGTDDGEEYGESGVEHSGSAAGGADKGVAAAAPGDYQLAFDKIRRDFDAIAAARKAGRRG